MTKKIIIYLDQWLISNIAKASLSLIEDKNTQELYLSLYKTLKKLVQENKITCPISEHHFEETLLWNGKRKKKVFEIILELSGDLFFQPSFITKELLEEDGLYKFLNVPSISPSWIIHFQRDPNLKNSSKITSKYFDSFRYVFHRKEKLKPQKQKDLKNLIEIKKLEKAFEQSLKDERTARKIFYVKTILRFLIKTELPQKAPHLNQQELQSFVFNSPHTKKFFSDEEINNAVNFYSKRDFLMDSNVFFHYQKLKSIWDKRENRAFEIFWDSDVFKNISENKIFYELVSTVLQKQHKKTKRNPKPGDMSDINRLAQAIPCCDVVCCDGEFMQMCNKLKYNNIYNVLFFSAKKNSILEFQNFLETLSN